MERKIRPGMAADPDYLRKIKLDRPLPVYILYFTAWAQEDGTSATTTFTAAARPWTVRWRRW